MYADSSRLLVALPVEPDEVVAYDTRLVGSGRRLWTHRFEPGWSHKRTSSAASRATISRMADLRQAVRPDVPIDTEPRPAADESRLTMMRRIKRLDLEERLDLFERISRDAAWVRGAKRVR